jgi:Family of unknown function (DUF6064)
MSDWWSYSPSNFLMFSARVYYRLFELYNREVWPAQLAIIVLGLALLYLLVKGGAASGRLISAILGVLWIWVAWGFLLRHFATINWPIGYVVPVFAVEGLLLIGAGAIGRGLTFSLDRTAIAGMALFLAAALLYPLIAPLMGRSWLSAELFGLAPDPTVIATLALLAIAEGRGRWLMMVIPCLWCAISTLTLGVMGSADFFVPLAGAIAAVGIAMARASLRPADRIARGG